MKRVLVVTTINSSSHEGLNTLIQNAKTQKYDLIIVGDEKTPSDLASFSNPRVEFYSLDSQRNSIFSSGILLPKNHYARKNLGYLIAASRGVEWISETDDDNNLYPAFWDSVNSDTVVRNQNNSKWVNIYKNFNRGDIWHRGIPIANVRESNQTTETKTSKFHDIACIQGLADGDPDIDAICRMLISPVAKFNSGNSFLVESPEYCPTNSQMTRWKTSATLPLLYLPSTVPWRVSDIWRGYIAQRYFHIMSLSTQFRGGLGYQNRNFHDLMVDFRDEYAVHTDTFELIEILESVSNSDPLIFLCEVYSALASKNLVGKVELERVEGWLSDVARIKRTVLNLNPPLD